jgi:hypothetical protein
MSKAKMIAARELINEKKYNEARAILEQVNHPTAEKWLTKLDEIAPPARATSINRWMLAALVVTVSIALIGVIAALVLANSPGGSKPSLEEQTEAAILFCMNFAEGEMSRQECSDWVDIIIADFEYSDIIANCTELYNDDLERLSVCMRDILAIGEQRQYDKMQVIWLGDYCVVVTDLNNECWDWAIEVTNLYPATEECWDYHLDMSLEGEWRLVYAGQLAADPDMRENGFNCISEALGDRLPALPSQ